jgi:serine/threonine-protein kinase
MLALGGAVIELARAQPARRPKLEGIELRGLVGKGVAGAVHAGWQDPPGREVAVKTVLPGSDEEDARRLVREAVLEGRLDHPSIARVFDLIDAKGTLYLVRELVKGETLARRVARGPLAPAEVRRAGRELAEALAHAHARQVVHRDVKPDNVVLEEGSGRAKLLDFGFAKDVRAELTRLTATGESFGALCYVAPEQLDGARDAGPPADVYGLGAVLYFALSGKAPFGDVPSDQFVERLRGEGPTDLGELAPDAPADLVATIRRAMSAKPARRPSAATLARALGSV